MPNIIHITDFSAPELDIFARKTENQLLNREHPEEGIFIAESPKVVERALDGGYAPVAVLVECGFITNEGDAHWVYEHPERVALAIALGVAAWCDDELKKGV